MSQSVRDLLDGATTAGQSMRWLAADSQQPCPAAEIGTGDGGGVIVKRCVLVGRHDQHQLQEDQ